MPLANNFSPIWWCTYWQQIVVSVNMRVTYKTKFARRNRFGKASIDAFSTFSSES